MRWKIAHIWLADFQSQDLIREECQLPDGHKISHRREQCSPWVSVSLGIAVHLPPWAKCRDFRGRTWVHKCQGNWSEEIHLEVSVYILRLFFRIVYSSWFLPSFFSVCLSNSIVYHSYHIMFLLSGRSSVPLGIISNPTKEISAP